MKGLNKLTYLYEFVCEKQATSISIMAFVFCFFNSCVCACLLCQVSHWCAPSVRVWQRVVVIIIIISFFSHTSVPIHQSFSRCSFYRKCSRLLCDKREMPAFINWRRKRFARSRNRLRKWGDGEKKG